MSDAVGEEKNTTVAIRLRPLNDKEEAARQRRVWRCVPSHNSVTQTTPEGTPLPDAKGSSFFTYDRIFDENSTTQEVYGGVARDLVHSVVRGMNSTIFAYGQTSSGKTFTMQGGGTEDSPGIVQMATRDLFNLMDETRDRVFLMRVSYLEIYQEDIKDLLRPDIAKLQVREDPRKGVYIEAHEEVVAGYEHVLRILAMGEQQRHVGCTEMNSRSSRSHTIFRLVVESQQHYVPGLHASEEDVDSAVLVATLNLVDLAGSESVRHTGATGLRQKEGGKINQSLLTLSRVIQTLSQGGSAHVNYRDSKLTRILQPSLSGNAGMAIICCATSAESFLEETRSTFQFASRAKQIKTRAMVNEVLDDKAQLRRMSQELAALRRQQAESNNGSALQGKVEILQAEKAEQAAKIERLCNLIINTANKPAAAVAAAAAAAAATTGDIVANTEPEIHLDISPRTRRSKRSRETWCPGESGAVRSHSHTLPHPQGLLEKVMEDLDEEDWDRLQKRRSSSPRRSSADCMPRSPSQALGYSNARSEGYRTPRTPASRRSVDVGVGTTPTVLSPARARAEREVAEMRVRLASLEAERNAMAEEEAATAATAKARVEDLEQQVASLNGSLEAATTSAAEARKAAESSEAAGKELAQRAAEEKDREVEAMKAKVKEATKMRDDLQAELTEFCEYTENLDHDMVQLKESLAKTEKELRQKEADLATIRASEEQEGRNNALRIRELHGRIAELEDVIKACNGKTAKQSEEVEDVTATAAQKDLELVALKSTLESCQKELAEYLTRANDAESKFQDLSQEMAATKNRLEEEKHVAGRMAQEATESAEAAALREAEVKALLKEREDGWEAEKSKLETENAHLQEEEAELRVLKESAEKMLNELETHTASTGKSDADAQTDLTSEAVALAEDVEGAKKAASDARAEVEERDRVLEGLRERVRELDDLKDAAEAAKSESMAQQRQVQDALSASNQAQLEMRCQLEEAAHQVQTVEAAVGEKEEEIAALKERLAESESSREAVSEAEAAASTVTKELRATAEAASQEAEEARRQVAERDAVIEAKNAKVVELEEIVGRLNSDLSEFEERMLASRDAQEQIRLEKEAEEAKVVALGATLDAARLDYEERSKVSENASREHLERLQDLSNELAALDEENKTVKIELADARAAEEQARSASADEASRKIRELSESSTARFESSKAEIDRLEQAAEASASELAALQEELKVKNEKLARLDEMVEASAAEHAAEKATAEAVAHEERKARVLEVGELQKHVKDLTSELEAVQLAAENSALEVKQQTERADAAENVLSEADEARRELKAQIDKTRDSMAELDIEANELREKLAEIQLSVARKDEEIDLLHETAKATSASLCEFEGAASAAKEELSEKIAVIGSLEERLEANTGAQEDLAQALDESENLSREVLDLTEELMEKEARLTQEATTVAELQQQVKILTDEMEEMQSNSSSVRSSSTVASTDDIGVKDLEAAVSNAEAEVRRLRVELDKKGSEIDSSVKENADLRAEIKEIKVMLHAAEQGADAAGADEGALRKRLSQLTCENGLLKGEKDRLESLIAAGERETKSAAARATKKIESLERELVAQTESATKVTALAAERDEAIAALEAAKAKLIDLHRERTELEEAKWRFTDRIAEAEAEAGLLRERIAEFEGRGVSAAEKAETIAKLETQIDALQEEVRRADASRAEAESQTKQGANRAERLQGEIEMMRSEYEMVSEEAAELRARVAIAEEQLQHAEASEAEVKELRARLEAEEETLAAARAEAGELGERIHAADERRLALEKQMDELHERVVGGEKVAAEAESEARQLRERLATACDDLRAAEVNTDELSGRVMASEQSLEASEAETKELRQRIAAAEESVREAKAEAARYSEVASSAEKGLSLAKTVETEVESLRERVKTAEEALGEAQEAKERQAEEAETLRNRLLDATEEMRSAEVQVTELRAGAATAEERLVESQAETLKLRERVVVAEESLRTSEASKTEQNDETAALRARLSAAESGLRKAEREACEDRTRLENADNALRVAEKEVAELCARVSDLEGSLREAEAAGAEQTAEIVALRARSTVADDTLVEAEAEASELRTMFETAKEGLRTVESKAEELQSQVVTMEEKLRTAETAGVEKVEEMEKLHARLSATEGELQEARVEAKELHARVVAAEEGMQVSKTEAEELRERVSAIGGNLDTATAVQAERTKEVEALRARLSAAEKSLDDSETEAKELRAQVVAAEQGLRSSETEAKLLQGRISTLEANLRMTEAAKATGAGETEILRESLLDAEARVRSAEEEASDLHARVAAAEEGLRIAETEANELRRHISTAEEGLQVAESAKIEQAEVAETLRARLSAAENDVENSETEASELRARVVAAEDGLRLSETEAKELQGRILEVEASLRATEVAKTKEAEETEALRTRLLASEEGIQIIQADFDGLRARLLTTTERLEAAEVVKEVADELRERASGAENSLREEREEARTLRERLVDAERDAQGGRREAEALVGRLNVAEHACSDLELRLADAEHKVEDAESTSKAMERQLRHRLENQVAEAESLRDELAAARQCADIAEASARAAEQRSRDGADESKKALLGEMETLMEEKLAAEAHAQGMESELGELRATVASAEQRAAEEQSLVIKAAQERIAGLEQAVAEKDRTMDELRDALVAARDSEAKRRLTQLTEKLAQGETILSQKNMVISQLQRRVGQDTRHLDRVRELETAARDAQHEKEGLEKKLISMGEEHAGAVAAASASIEKSERRVTALRKQVEEAVDIIEKRDARIKRLEEVRLTNDQVEKLRTMKMNGIAAAAENKELKRRLAELEGASNRGGSGSRGEGSGGSASLAASEAAAAAETRISELVGVKEALLKKVREYGTRLADTERERELVRAAVEEAGISAPKGRDLSEAVLELAEKISGADSSSMSTTSDDEGEAVAAAEHHQFELQEVREALRRAEAEKEAMQDQMRAGVSKFRTLEAQESASKELLEKTMKRLEATEEEARQLRDAREKEKDQSRTVKFLEEENLQLYKDNKEANSKAERYKAELQGLREQQANSVGRIAQPQGKVEKVLSDATDSQKTPRKPCTPVDPNVEIQAAPAPAALVKTSAKPSGAAPLTAADRRRQSVALLEARPVEDESTGECTQS